MARNRVSASQQKARKQRKIAIVLVALLGLVAFIQVPKLMKQLSAKPPAEVIAPPSSGTTAAGAATAAPAAAATQLRSFTLLPLKDPFKALVREPGQGSSGSGAASAPSAPAATPPPAPTPKPKPAKQPAPEPAASGMVGFTAAAPPPNAAIVKTNGHPQTVYLGDGFPSTQPVFRLVSLAGEKGVRIGVLGGSFTTGAPTIKLAAGTQVTLANQADGSLYVIKLVKLTNAAPKTQPAAGKAAPATK